MTEREQFEVFSVAALNLTKKAHFAVIELSVYPNGDVLREICNRLQAARAAPAQGYATLTGDNRLIWHNRAAPAQPEGEK